MPLIDFETNVYDKGLHTKIEDQAIPEGAYSNSLNILTRGDKWEIRRGYARLGNLVTGSGVITGLHTGRQVNGTEQVYRTRGRKMEHYDVDTDTWIEISSALLGADADGEEVAFADYQSLAGAQTWGSSKNSDLFKIMNANPASFNKQFLNGANYKGRLSIKDSRMWMWDILDSNDVPDRTQIYGSKQDKDELSDYTNLTNENIGTGDGSEVTFTATLAFKAGGAKRTCFGITVTDDSGSENFTDDKNGVLVGSNGGTGTINYTTGAISVTFNTAPANLDNILADYFFEDSTSGGIADFAFTTPTRIAGEGFFFPQNDGGIFQNIFNLDNVQYCFHEFKTWVINLTQDDTNATNLPFRSKIGIPNSRAAVETADGIYYIDDIDVNDPSFRILTFAEGSTVVKPRTISSQLDLTNFRFNKAACAEFGDFVLFACRTSDSDDNNRVLIFNKLWGSFDVVDYFVSTFSVFDGALISGDSIGKNVYTLFSGLDDDDAITPFFMEGRLEDYARLGLNDRMKELYQFEVQGEIGPDQIVDVFISVDRGSFVKIGQIRGDGSYVDRTQAVNIGSFTLGRGEIGGQGDGLTAFNYYRAFELQSISSFQQIKIKFANGVDETSGAEGIGYFSVSRERHRDIRRSYQRIPSKYTN